MYFTWTQPCQNVPAAGYFSAFSQFLATNSPHWTSLNLQSGALFPDGSRWEEGKKAPRFSPDFHSENKTPDRWLDFTRNPLAGKGTWCLLPTTPYMLPTATKHFDRAVDCFH